jgi:hypothetical protein
MLRIQEIWNQFIIENILRTHWKIVSSSVVVMVIDMPDCSTDLSAGVQMPMESMERPIDVIHHVQVMLNKYAVDLELTVSMMFHLE